VNWEWVEVVQSDVSNFDDEFGQKNVLLVCRLGEIMNPETPEFG
jgi:hypothetical protein